MWTIRIFGDTTPIMNEVYVTSEESMLFMVSMLENAKYVRQYKVSSVGFYQESYKHVVPEYHPKWVMKFAHEQSQEATS